MPNKFKVLLVLNGLAIFLTHGYCYHKFMADVKPIMAWASEYRIEQDKQVAKLNAIVCAFIWPLYWSREISIKIGAYLHDPKS